MNLKEAKEADFPVRRITYLDQPFFPFNPEENLVKRQKHYPFDIITTNIDLVLSSSMKFPIDIQLALDRADSRISIITPFNPGLGYTIDSEDLKIETRKAKVKRISREQLMKGEEELDFAKAPFRLSVETEPGFTLKRTHSIPLAQETVDFLAKIRLLVRLGEGGSFEARVWEPVVSSGALWFREFYPQDAPPLPAENERFSAINEGFSLYLPDDPGKLRQIQMRFGFIPEQMQDASLASK